MEQFFISLGVALLLLVLTVLYRVITGPTAIDRIVGVNVIGTKTTIMIVLIGVLAGRVEMFVDIALTYALLNFITSLAAARFFQRHRRVPLEDESNGETA